MMLLLPFCSRFPNVANQKPGRLYLSFVLTATTYLVLGAALVLSAFSLPADFKSKTIYTVVTKPVRAGDIVLGRILGFTLVGTVLLAMMGLISAVFVWRMLDHTHAVRIDTLQNVYDNDGKVIAQKGRTTIDWIAIALGAAGIALLVWFVARGRRTVDASERDDSVGTEADEAGIESTPTERVEDDAVHTGDDSRG